MRTEDLGHGIVSVALHPEGQWASTTAPHALIVVDWDDQHDPITITFAGPLARIALSQGIPSALKEARRTGDDIEVHQEGARAWDAEEIATLQHAVDQSVEAIPG